MDATEAAGLETVDAPDAAKPRHPCAGRFTEETFFRLRDGLEDLADAIVARLRDGEKATFLAICKEYHDLASMKERGIGLLPPGREPRPDDAPNLIEADMGRLFSAMARLLDGLDPGGADRRGHAAGLARPLSERSALWLCMGLRELARCDVDPTLRSRASPFRDECLAPAVARCLVDLRGPRQEADPQPRIQGENP